MVEKLLYRQLPHAAATSILPVCPPVARMLVPVPARCPEAGKITCPCPLVARLKSARHSFTYTIHGETSI